MRVVAGAAGGRTLKAPGGRGTRPTSERVREAVFSALESLGAVEGASVLDLFAGSGALGIEALSRGAASATFVDSSPLALAAIRANLGVLGEIARSASVVRADALDYAGSAAWSDLVFVDPPYAFEGWGRLWSALASRAGLVVAETRVSAAGLCEPGPAWETVRVKRYGATVVLVAGQPGHRHHVYAAAPSYGEAQR